MTRRPYTIARLIRALVRIREENGPDLPVSFLDYRTMDAFPVVDVSVSRPPADDPRAFTPNVVLK